MRPWANGGDASWSRVWRANQGFQIAILLVSHDLFAAQSVCDRAAVLHEGKTVVCDTIAQIFPNQASLHSGAIAARPTATYASDRRSTLIQRWGRKAKNVRFLCLKRALHPVHADRQCVCKQELVRGFREDETEHPWDNATKFGSCPWKPSTLALSGTPHNGDPIGQCRAPVPVEHLFRAAAPSNWRRLAYDRFVAHGGLSRFSMQSDWE